MYYYSPFEAHAAIDEYERTVAHHRLVSEAMGNTADTTPTTKTRTTGRNWFSRRAPLAVFSFGRHA